MKDKEELIPWSKIKPEHVQDDLPFVKFNAKDWLTDKKIINSSHYEKGIYIQLLMHTWVDPDCALDPSRESIRNLMGDRKQLEGHFKVSRKFFCKHPYRAGMFTQRRLMYERVEAVRFRKQKSRAGKKGMRSRWGKDNSVITELSEKDNSVITIRKNSNSKKEDKTKNITLPENPAPVISQKEFEKMKRRFEFLWNRYPNPVGKVKARKAFQTGYKKEGVIFYKRTVFAIACFWIFIQNKWSGGQENRTWPDGGFFFSQGYLDWDENFKNRTLPVRKRRR